MYYISSTAASFGGHQLSSGISFRMLTLLPMYKNWNCWNPRIDSLQCLNKCLIIFFLVIISTNNKKIKFIIFFHLINIIYFKNLNAVHRVFYMYTLKLDIDRKFLNVHSHVFCTRLCPSNFSSSGLCLALQTISIIVKNIVINDLKI